MTQPKESLGVRLLGFVRRNVHWLRTAFVAGVVLCVLATVFMAFPNPVFAVAASGEHWLLAIIGILGFLVLRILLTDDVLRIGSRVVNENHIYDRYASRSDPNLLLDRYLGHILDTRWEGSVPATTTAIVTPSTLTDRISERRALGETRSAVTVSRTFTGAPDLRAAPALRVAKGTLVGALTVHVNGKAARTLTTAQARGLLLVALYGGHDDVFPASSPFLTEAVPAVLADRSIDDVLLDTLLGHIDQVEATNGVTPASRALRTLTRLATTCDFVFVDVPDGCKDATKVTISYHEAYGTKVRSVGSRVRRLFGLGRRDYIVDIHSAAEAASYHLDMEGHEDMFIQNAYVTLPYQRTDDSSLRPAPRSPDRAEYMFIRSPQGDSSIHLYARDLDASDILVGEQSGKKITAKPHFVVELRERPPGILGPTLALSAWLVAVTWVVGLNYGDVFASTSPGSSWPAVIFGVPALVAGWLLSKMTKDVLRVISIPTFLCVAWVAVNSALLVTLAALSTTGIELGVVNLGRIHLEHPTWAFMMWTTAFALAVCLWLFIVRSARYASTINKGSEQ